MEFLGNVIKISSTQNKVLEILHKNIELIIDSEDIFNYVYPNSDKEFTTKNVRNIISTIRKLVPCISIENIYGGKYILKKQPDYYDEFKSNLLDIIDQSKNGIVITNPNMFDNPIIYVNKEFENIFGYSFNEIVHQNCRFLQGNNHNQEELSTLKEAINNRESITVRLKNYHKSGTLIENELTISPIFDNKNKIKFFLGVQNIIVT